MFKAEGAVTIATEASLSVRRCSDMPFTQLTFWKDDFLLRYICHSAFCNFHLRHQYLLQGGAEGTTGRCKSAPDVLICTSPVEVIIRLICDTACGQSWRNYAPQANHSAQADQSWAELKLLTKPCQNYDKGLPFESEIFASLAAKG